ncbi:MAG: RidA family protein [Maricaulaceae bacterium]|nr:RidA family protein [Maricaulaceae bacterium]
MSDAETRLKQLGVALPSPAAPVANYVPFVRTGASLYVSGQVSLGPDGLMKGRLGEDMDIAAGQAAARQCAVNLIAQVKAALGGDLSRLRRVVKLGGFVNAAGDFTDIPQVINGASDLMVAVFGDAGRHARSAVACPTLPLGAAVEIDGVFEVS